MTIEKEILTSERGSDGLWHARYPTATVTLCGRKTVGFKKGRKRPPTCANCCNTARRFDEVDGTMPDHWATPAALEATIDDLKTERGRLVDRVRELERSRDLWKQRALARREAA
jgi:hypothetical protein